MILEGTNIPAEILLIWKEKQRERDIATDSGSFQEKTDADDAYNTVAHFVMKEAYAEMMDTPVNEGVTH